MHAVIFDIDGTIIDSNEADGKLYVDALRQALGNVYIRPEWSDYRDVSDSGILQEVLEDNSIDVNDSRVSLVQRYFVDSIALQISRNGPFLEVPGAKSFVSSLSASPDYKVAYATGGWSASAVIKLRSAGFPLEQIPLATSDANPVRTEIMLSALAQLGDRIESVTYYGDGVWDSKAAAQLGWRFVPVGKKLSGLERYGSISA